jgi:hypothetical protein
VDDVGESFYREAVERLERSRVAVPLASAHLVYGEWLRRSVPDTNFSRSANQYANARSMRVRRSWSKTQIARLAAQARRDNPYGAVRGTARDDRPATVVGSLCGFP